MSRMNPSHPGLSVLDSLEAVGWNVTEFADRLGISESEVSGLLNGKRGISPAMALALERMGWSNADFWVRLQAYYDLAQERRRQARNDPAQRRCIQADDPIFSLGKNPIEEDLGMEDASVNHDKYIYTGM